MKRRDLLKLLPALALPMPARAAPRPAPLSLGLNLAPVTYWSTEHPFNNLALSASRWRLQPVDAPFSWDLPLPPATPDGYPLVVPGGSFLESFLVFTPHRAHLPEELTLSYEGQGTIEYLAGCTLLRREKGRDIIRNLRTEAPLIARLTATSAEDPLRAVVLGTGGETLGETFRTPFLDRLSGMSVLRFMDWMDTNNSPIVRWDERPQPGRFSQTEGGVALELMVELCNRLSVAPWFTLPHLADDDHVRRFARLVRDTLAPELPVYVEYSNELWNGLFEQSQHAMREGMRLGLSSNQYEAGLRFHSQRSSEVIAIWEDEFGPLGDRVLGVYGAHAVNAWSSEVVLSWGDASKHADVLAIAPYFGGGLGGREQAATTASWSLDQLFEALESEVDGINRDWLRDQSAMAGRFGVQLAAYEGGQHLVGYSGTPHDETLHRLFAEANRDPRMGALYRKHLSHWAEAGGGPYALFNSMGPPSQWGCWGLLEHEAQTTSPKWHAVREALGA